MTAAEFRARLDAATPYPTEPPDGVDLIADDFTPSVDYNHPTAAEHMTARCAVYELVWLALVAFARIDTLTAERDAAREEFQKIGRKAFWASKAVAG